MSVISREMHIKSRVSKSLVAAEETWKRCKMLK